MDNLLHPNVHARSSDWSELQTLHLVVVYSNPRRWDARRERTNDAIHHLRKTPNVRVHLVELAYGDRPFDVTRADHPDDTQLRTSHELWHKENLINIGIQHVPLEAQYLGYCDADFAFSRHDWALETIQLLQHYSWVQLFSYVTYLKGDKIPGEGHQPIHTIPSFALTYAQNGYRVPDDWEKNLLAGYGAWPKDIHRFPGAPGGAWAFRRQAFNDVGGMMDRCIVGSADSFMAFGLVGAFRGMTKSTFAKYPPVYIKYIVDWQRRAAKGHGDIFYVDNHATHHFHGPMSKRGYGDRDQILTTEKYDPYADVYKDGQGVLQLNPDKPGLRNKLRSYFLSRCEDLTH